MASRLVRWGVVASVGSVLILIPVAVLARPYIGSVFGFSCAADQAPSLTDLRSVDELRTRFDADAGSPRLVLLVSPTWVECKTGASWVQRDILEEHPNADLRVYVVWFNMLSGDSRSGWDSCTVSDPRATNLWDEDRLISTALGPSVKGASPPVWDAYLLYGPDARWDSAPPRPTSTGTPIYPAREDLQKDVLPLLGERK